MTDVEQYTPLSSSELDLIRRQVAPKASDNELMFFAKYCDRFGLNPFLGQVYFLNLNGAHRPYISAEGRLAIAARTGLLRGIEGPQYRRARTSASDEPPWEDYWEGDGNPYVARCVVWRADWDKPGYGTARWAEFGKSTPVWKQYPQVMLGKVAMARALRIAFPEWVTPALEEVDESDAPIPTQAPTIEPAYVIHRDEDAHAAREAREHTTALKQQLRALWQECECAGPDSAKTRQEVVSTALGREVDPGDPLDDDELERIIVDVTRLRDDGWKGF